jgi:hypothetical protein
MCGPLRLLPDDAQRLSQAQQHLDRLDVGEADHRAGGC